MTANHAETDVAERRGTVEAPATVAADTWTRRVVPSAAEIDPVAHARHTHRVNLFLGWLTPTILIAVWQVSASIGWLDTRFFPSPTTIVRTATEMVGNGSLQQDVWISSQRIILGLLLGCAVGVVAGLFMGTQRLLRALFEPVLNAVYTVPKLALLPMLLLIFGLGELPKIFLVALGTFFLMWITTLEAVVALPPEYSEAAASFSATPWQQFVHVIVPGVLTNLFVGLRLATGNAVLVLVGVEFVQSRDGIGYRIWHSWSLFAADQMYVGIVAVAVLGLLFQIVVMLLHRVLVPWSALDR